MRWVFSGLALVAVSTAFAQDAKVSFYKDVRPILQQNCQGCHQPAKAQGGYVMTEYAALLKSGDSAKPGIVPGKPESSYLLTEIHVNKDGKSEMPKNGTPLPANLYAVIENWVKQGAVDDTPASARTTEIDAEHPPVYLAPPVITSLAFDPQGKMLAVTGYHEVLLYGVADLKLQARLIGLSERVQSIAFNPDGTLLAVAGGNPGRFGEIQIWDVAKRKLKVSAPVTFDTVYGLAWNPEGTLVAFGCSDNTVRAIDPKTGKQVLQMGTHSDWVLGTAFSQDGLNLASVGRDMSMKLTEVGTQRFVDNVTSITPGGLRGGLMALDRRPLRTKTMAKIPADAPTIGNRVYDELLAAGSDGVPRLYKMHREVKREIGDDSNKLNQFDAMLGRISAVRFDAGGTRFAAASGLDGKGEVAVYDLGIDKPLFLELLGGTLGAAATRSARADMLATARAGGKKWAKCEGISGPAFAVAWSPDGKTLASGGFDGKVWLHDPKNGKLLKEFVVQPK